MSIITITSDYGNSDPYLAVMKGQLFSQLENVNIVDISNEIDKFNIAQAAFVVRNSFQNFPKNTVHLVMVGTFSPSIDFIIVKHAEQFFIGLDNGLFSLVFENLPILAYHLTLSAPPELASFPEKSILVQAASHLSRGGVPEVIGEPIQGLTQMISYAPVIQNDTIRFTVQYIDSYGNVITNLSKDLFLKHLEDRNIEIRFRIPHARVTKLSKRYSDVEPGEIVAFFNTSGYLEISINSGKASSLLGIRINETISLNFL
jgi:S-adenosylmethionine hydrolase